MISRDGGWLSVMPSDAGACVLHVSCMEGDRVSGKSSAGKGTETGKSVSTDCHEEHLIRKQMSLPKYTLLRRVLHIYRSKEFVSY